MDRIKIGIRTTDKYKTMANEVGPEKISCGKQLLFTSKENNIKVRPAGTIQNGPGPLVPAKSSTENRLDLFM